MKTPTVIGIVVALHGVVIGTLLVTAGCGTFGGRRSKPVTFEEQPPVLPKPEERVLMPEPPAPKPVFKSEELIREAKPEAKRYVVQKGETVSHIAQRFKVKVSEIRELNPEIPNLDRIREGQTLLLPAYVDLKAPPPPHPQPKKKPALESKPVATPPLSGGETYVVKAGDTPETIARKFGVKVADLMTLNKITDPKRLRIGQKLAIPAKAGGAAEAPATPAVPAVPVTSAVSAPMGRAPAEPTAELVPMVPAVPLPLPPATGAPVAVQTAVPVGTEYHVVVKGETLRDIAMLYQTTIEEIQAANNLKGDQVVEGQKLLIPKMAR